jgi:hypothetical protein
MQLRQTPAEPKSFAAHRAHASGQSEKPIRLFVLLFVTTMIRVLQVQVAWTLTTTQTRLPASTFDELNCAAQAHAGIVQPVEIYYVVQGGEIFLHGDIDLMEYKAALVRNPALLLTVRVSASGTPLSIPRRIGHRLLYEFWPLFFHSYWPLFCIQVLVGGGLFSISYNRAEIWGAVAYGLVVLSAVVIRLFWAFEFDLGTLLANLGIFSALGLTLRKAFVAPECIQCCGINISK